jgi:hypothetical protein
VPTGSWSAPPPLLAFGQRANSLEQAYPRPSPDAAIELARRYCLRRNSGRQCIHSETLAVIPHLPDLLRRRSCRIPARIAASWSQGPNCLTNFLSRGPCAKWIFHSLCVLAVPCKIHNKSQKNPKIENPILQCSVWQELQLSPKMYVFLSYSFCLKNRNVKSLDLCFCKIYTSSCAIFRICCTPYRDWWPHQKLHKVTA